MLMSISYNNELHRLQFTKLIQFPKAVSNFGIFFPNIVSERPFEMINCEQVHTIYVKLSLLKEIYRLSETYKVSGCVCSENICFETRIM